MNLPQPEIDVYLKELADDLNLAESLSSQVSWRGDTLEQGETVEDEWFFAARKISERDRLLTSTTWLLVQRWRHLVPPHPPPTVTTDPLIYAALLGTAHMSVLPPAPDPSLEIFWQAIDTEKPASAIFQALALTRAHRSGSSPHGLSPIIC
jgi:hypothetical protein